MTIEEELDRECERIRASTLYRAIGDATDKTGRSILQAIVRVALNRGAAIALATGTIPGGAPVQPGRVSHIPAAGPGDARLPNCGSSRDEEGAVNGEESNLLDVQAGGQETNRVDGFRGGLYRVRTEA